MEVLEEQGKEGKGRDQNLITALFFSIASPFASASSTLFGRQLFHFVWA